MDIFQGIGVSKGIAIGTLSFFKREQLKVEKKMIEDSAAELAKFEQARTRAITQLGVLAEELAQSLGQESAQLFEVHQMMLEDEDYIASIHTIIQTEQVCAEYAVEQTGIQFAEMFLQTEDDYMQARAADVKDISTRVVRILMGKQDETGKQKSKSILASDDFVPSETAQFDRNLVLALVTAQGSANSHTAIFARTMGIPAVIGLQDMLQESFAGSEVIVDGNTGMVYVNPDDETRNQFTQLFRQEQVRKTQLTQLKGKENKTKDGRKIDVYANIGSVEDAELALENDAGGVGLFRSEFLYLQSEDYPSEEAQFAAYKAVLEKMNNRRVVIRTLDIGADKQVDYFEMQQEENPALGYRAVRICLDRPDIFLTQLRALYRASAFGKLAIMVPMIISCEEVNEVMQLVQQAKTQLREQAIAFDETVEVGIMIETPAAAIISDLLAKKVDFFSVGTNDLTQYTLAIDRQNQKLGRFYNPHHTALLRLIRMAAENIHKEGKWIGICGELGADLALTETFLEMGIDELSVSPSAVLPLREKIRSLNLSATK